MTTIFLIIKDDFQLYRIINVKEYRRVKYTEYLHTLLCGVVSCFFSCQLNIFLQLSNISKSVCIFCSFHLCFLAEQLTIKLIKKMKVFKN